MFQQRGIEHKTHRPSSCAAPPPSSPLAPGSWSSYGIHFYGHHAGRTAVAGREASRSTPVCCARTLQAPRMPDGCTATARPTLIRRLHTWDGVLPSRAVRKLQVAARKSPHVLGRCHCYVGTQSLVKAAFHNATTRTDSDLNPGRAQGPAARTT